MADRIAEWMAESLRLADQATEGPWTWSAAAHGDPTGGPTHHAVRARDGVVAETDYDIHGALDAEFIAETRTRFPQAVAALNTVASICGEHFDWQMRRAEKFGRSAPDCSCEVCRTMLAVKNVLGSAEFAHRQQTSSNDAGPLGDNDE